MAQEVDVDHARTVDFSRSVTREESAGELRSLGRQARLIALACLVVDLANFFGATPDLPTALRVTSLAVIVCVDAALALPPRYSGALAAAHAAAAVGLALVLQTTPNADWGLAGGLIAAYRVGAWMRRRSGSGAILALAVAAAVGGSIAYSPTALTMLLAAVQNAFIPWLVGRYTSARRGYVSELRHNRELELRDATAAAERAAERLRTSIARDLHDVVAHHVSAIGVHAGAARLRLTARPDFAAPEIIDSLTAVETSSRSAMLDLRRVLDILHGTPDSTIQPGLDNLDELFDGVRRSGAAIRFQESGRPRALPGSVDTALYRIAQEMLTNALRHGDGTTVEVDLTFGDDAVVLSTRNGIGQPSGDGDLLSTGRGLAGIRSRVALFGGHASHGPVAGGRTWETRVDVCIDTHLTGDGS